MDKFKQLDRTSWFLIIGTVVLIVLIIFGWSRFHTPSTVNDMMQSASTTDQTTPSAMTNERPTVAAATGEAVRANDQSAGGSAIVSQASLSRVSWVAVRDDKSILGAARVTPPQGGGTVTDISVPLLRATEAGKTYTVVVYADDGDGQFDFKKDALVDGVSDTFNATAAEGSAE